MDIEKAKELLQNEYTCVLVKDDDIKLSTKSGISPMLDYLSEGVNLQGFSVADKIVGKAAAMLFAKAGIARVHAQVLSKAGANYLESQAIPFTYDELTDKIINRTGDDICPMEKTVENIYNADEAFTALLATRARLQNHSV